MSKRILIVGGVAGGMSAATRARRLDEAAEIVVFERGEFVSFANCGLPYYIAGEITDRAKILVATEHLLRTRFNIDVRARHEVLAIGRADKTVTVKDLRTGEQTTERYDTLILSPGATPIRPPLPGLDHPKVLTLRDVADMDRIHAALEGDKVKHAVIAGAGFIGLEMAEGLAGRKIETTVVDLAPQVLPPLDPEMAAEVHAALTRHDVAVVLGKGIAGVASEGADDLAVLLDDGTRLPADMVILSIGVRPETGLAKDAGITLGESGGIAVDGFQCTNDPDILAVGDAAESVYAIDGRAVRIPLAGPANRHGRVAGSVAAGSEKLTSPHVAGTAIVRVLDRTAGMTGLSEKAARQLGFDCQVAYAFGPDHASYYPGATEMIIKLVWENDTGKILGAQVVGGNDVARRVDIVATAIHFGGTVEDLESLDLAYAPPVGSVKDLIHLAGFIAGNVRRGESSLVSPSQLLEKPSDWQIVDVRSQAEYNAGAVDGALHIPVDELRTRHSELDPTRPTVVYCAVGKRGHVAQRLLTQKGFAQVHNLTGGHRAWALVKQAGVFLELFGPGGK